MHNHSGDNNALPGVYCDVKECYYNSLDRHCTADHIKVNMQTTSTCTDAVCDTFKLS